MHTTAPNRSFTVSSDKARLNLPWVVTQIKTSYWGNWLTDGQIMAAMDESLCFGLYMDEIHDNGEIVATNKQVGFCRVVTDYNIFSSITDMLIDEQYQRQGMGKILMAEVVKHPAVAGTVCVLQSRDAVTFYEKFGWRLGLSNVMRRLPQ